MPTEITTTDGATYSFRTFELGELRPDKVRIQVEFAAPKHGTEMHIFTGSPGDVKRWDGELRMYLPQPANPLSGERLVHTVGNTVVGTVLEVGSAVTQVRPGERVFAYGPIRDIHDADEQWTWPLGELSPEDAVCADPAHVAFVAVRDGSIRIGDTVAVYGLGAIGLQAVQIARAGGARRVIGVDPIKIRRDYAQAHGADMVLDPTACDAAYEIKLATGKKGVDVSIEISGNSRAFHDAIRCIRQCGTVVHVPWGPKDASHLHFDEEFHLNRPTIIGSQCWEGWGCPDRDYPRWDGVRQREAVRELFEAGLITGNGLCTPVVPFAEAPAMLAQVFANPAISVKAGVRFPS